MLGGPDRQGEPLYVAAMAIALALAAFLGAASGLIWQSAGFGSEEEREEEGEEKSPETATSG